MKIEIENLTIRVTRDDGQVLTFSLDEQTGLTFETDHLDIETDETGTMIVSVPFAAE